MSLQVSCIAKWGFCLENRYSILRNRLMAEQNIPLKSLIGKTNSFIMAEYAETGIIPSFMGSASEEILLKCLGYGYIFVMVGLESWYSFFSTFQYR